MLRNGLLASVRNLQRRKPNYVVLDALKTQRFGKSVNTTDKTSPKHRIVARFRLSGKAQGGMYADWFRSVIMRRGGGTEIRRDR